MGGCFARVRGLLRGTIVVVIFILGSVLVAPPNAESAPRARPVALL